jgi:rod shape-determining protein MreC
LRNQNARLLSELPSGSLLPDSGTRRVTDTLKLDSVRSYRQYQYFSARVISNSIFLQQNYLMLHRGSEQGIESNMAVVAPEGIIGTVVSVSKNMSTVMSLLHRQSKLIATLKKGSGLGEVSWDGKDPRYLQLIKIPKTVQVAKGDTVVTSPYSDRFPPGYIVGFVYTIEEDQETNTYNLVVRTGANFYNLQHAYVVKNLLKIEMDELNNKMIKP